MMTLMWQASKYKAHKFHQGHILKKGCPPVCSSGIYYNLYNYYNLYTPRHYFQAHSVTRSVQQGYFSKRLDK